MLGTHSLLAARIWQLGTAPSKVELFLRTAVIAILGSLLLTISAKVQVPFYPVPQTMQTFVVVLLGLVCGWRLAATSIALYLLQGLIGLPVFAKIYGIAAFTGPTAGYLIGFLSSGVLCGWLAERGWASRLPLALCAGFLGHALIYALGLTWLAGFVGYDWSKTLLLGFYPFAYGDLAKIVLLGLILPLSWRLFNKD